MTGNPKQRGTHLGGQLGSLRRLVSNSRRQRAERISLSSGLPRACLNMALVIVVSASAFVFVLTPQRAATSISTNAHAELVPRHLVGHPPQRDRQTRAEFECLALSCGGDQIGPEAFGKRLAFEHLPPRLAVERPPNSAT